MSNKNATMFLSDLTVVDHAYINQEGYVIGGSYNPGFIVSGPVDETEQVVVDFSRIKKEIKAIIDDKEQGFDHKLWVIVGYSNINKNYVTITDRNGVAHVCIDTPKVTLTMPVDAVRFVSDVSVDKTSRFDVENFDTEIGQAMGKYVTKELHKLGHAGIKVEVYNTTNIHTISTDNTALHASNARYANFRYVHGLKNSTSWGCQNIAHGHRSFIQIQTPTWSSAAAAQGLSEKIARYFDNTIFVNSKNIVSIAKNELKLQYETKRGFFEMVIKDATDTRVMISTTETTIEHLVKHIYNQFRTELIAIGATRLFVSEGLSKGAVVDISQE